MKVLSLGYRKYVFCMKFGKSLSLVDQIVIRFRTMASSSKKIKLSKDKTPQSAAIFLKKEPKSDSSLLNLQKLRLDTAQSILEFKFNKKRVKIISNEMETPENCEGVVYWMSRDCRVQDNWAMLFAQKLALKNEVPLHVCFCLLPKFLDATLRHFDFLLKGLEEVEKECFELDITFHLLKGAAGEILPQWVKKNKMGAVVCDFSPLRGPLSWVESVKEKLPKNVPMIQVDAHNVVPCWVASEKLEYSARTIRNKINSKLGEFLTQFPPVIKHPHKSDFAAKPIDWKQALETRDVDMSIGACSWATPGTEQGLKMLEKFCSTRLKIFFSKRNDPLANALSNLSPWFHFGQVSVQRAVLSVQNDKSKYSESVNAFCEEAIVRRELADNFCFYNENYDNLKGASNWAQITLDLHRKDKREYVYSTEQLRDALTHDDLWNSAQLQLVKEGKMHGFLRMYWAKKILEWTPTPEKALQDAIYLNDRYSLDGRDPNGFVGCMWSICGIHDQGWAERAIFGKIRFMNYAGCKRKFDISAFIVRYGGKRHKYLATEK